MRAPIATLLVLLAAACGGSGGAASKPAVALAFSVQPGAGSAVAPLAPAVKVELRDADGQVVAGAAAPVTLALVSPGPGAALAGTLTRSAEAGVATFGDLGLARAGAGYRLAASSPGLTGASSAPFDVAAGPPALLVVTGQPDDGRTSTALAPVFEVRVEDAVGNPVDGVEVQAGIATGPAGGALGGSGLASSQAGLATFGEVSLAGAGTYTLWAAVPGGPSVTSAPFTLADAWRSIGPDGGNVAVAADPADVQRALAGGQAGAGLWRTTDGGASWAPVAALSGRTLTPVFQAASTAWAYGDSLWRSGDGGLTWVESPDVVRSIDGAALRPAFDPASGAVVVAVNDYERRLLTSADGGASFTAVAPPLPDAYLLAVAAGPGGLAALTSQGFHALARDATAWTAPVAVDTNPYRLLLHPTDPAVAFVAGLGGIHRTADGGATWTQVAASLFKDLWLDPASPSTVLGVAIVAGVYRSTDGGLSFQPFGGPPAVDVRSLSGTAGRLYLGADTGPFASSDGGATWAVAAGGLRAGRITAVAVSPGDSSLLLAGTEAGELHRSVDGGAHWSRVLWVGSQPARQILFDTATPERVYLVNGGYLMVSTDSGATWSNLPASPPGLGSAARCASLPAHLWVSDQNGSGVWRSTDGGDGWSRVYTRPSTSLIVGEVAVDPADPLLAYAKIVDFSPGTPATGLHRTTDGGATWAKLAVNAYGGHLATGRGAGVVWSSTAFSLSRSVDAGVTFDPATPPLGAVASALAADPADAARLLVGTQGEGAWITADGGATWAPSRSGLARASVAALAVDPGAPEVVYAGTLGGGLLVSTTGGR